MLHGYTYLIYTYIVYTYKHISKYTTSLLFTETESSLKNLNEPQHFAILSHINSVHIFPYKPTFIKWSLPLWFPD